MKILALLVLLPCAALYLITQSGPFSANSGADLDMTAVGSINLAAGSGAGNAVYVSDPSILNVGVSVVNATCSPAANCQASCAAGSYVLSGGCSGVGPILDTSPVGSPSGWSCTLYSPGTTVTTHAVCARLQ
jgi:hypothetical protein